jgi:hypothetical protein
MQRLATQIQGGVRMQPVAPRVRPVFILSRFVATKTGTSNLPVPASSAVSLELTWCHTLHTGFTGFFHKSITIGIQMKNQVYDRITDRITALLRMRLTVQV